MDRVMFYEKEEVCELLRSMVRHITGNVTLGEDLFQEAVIHLWQKETKRPGQSQSWYVQNCRFHLFDFLRHGYTADSLNHASRGHHLSDDSNASGEVNE